MIDIKAYIYNEKLKEIKRSLGFKCRHLANRRSIVGDRSVDVGIVTPSGYKRFEFTMPTLLSDITESDYNQLVDLIKLEI